MMENSKEKNGVSIVINDLNKILIFQAQFMLAFPYLKLEFFLSVPGRKYYLSPCINPEETLGKYRCSPEKENLAITEGMSREDLDNKFISTYGLSVQLFRKSGKEWLRVTQTDKWTMAQQNEQGMALARLMSLYLRQEAKK